MATETPRVGRSSDWGAGTLPGDDQGKGNGHRHDDHELPDLDGTVQALRSSQRTTPISVKCGPSTASLSERLP